MAMKTALVLSGGGARGAYQVGVLKAIADAVPDGTQPFPIITGVSVGALNAAVLATSPDNFKEGAGKLESIWRNLHCGDVYRTDARSVLKQFSQWTVGGALGWAGASPPKSVFDNAPLKELVSTHVDFDQINATVGKSSLEALAITASSYENGMAITFVKSHRDCMPWRRSRRLGRLEDLSTDHVLASSALPLVFPARQINGAYFGDGALRENAPLSAAIHLGCDQILTIGARDGTPDEAKDQEHPPYPSIGELAGHMMDILFNDNMNADIERLTRINLTLEKLSDAERDKLHLRTIGFHSLNPSQDVRGIAGKHAKELPSSVRLLLRLIGAMKAPYVLPSYLTFEPGYINALIDLGHQDAQDQIEKLSAFVGA